MDTYAYYIIIKIHFNILHFLTRRHTWYKERHTKESTKENSNHSTNMFINSKDNNNSKNNSKPNYNTKIKWKLWLIQERPHWCRNCSFHMRMTIWTCYICWSINNNSNQILPNFQNSSICIRSRRSRFWD